LNEDHYTEEVRRFLLGELSEEERAAFEDRFLSDEDLSAQALVVEDELIESYLHNELSAQDRKKFETAYLNNPRRRERVVALKAVVAAANAEPQPLREKSLSLWARLREYVVFKNAFPRYALAGLALIAMIAAAWLFLRSREPHASQIAQVDTNSQPTPVTIASPSPAASTSPTPAVTPSLRPTPTPVQQESGPAFASIVLQPTLVRDPAAAKRLVLPATVKLVRLQLNLERNEYKSFLVQITTVEGKSVWQSRTVTPAGASVAVSVPASLLPTNDYVIELSGVTSERKRESVASYFFTVLRN